MVTKQLRYRSILNACRLRVLIRNTFFILITLLFAHPAFSQVTPSGIQSQLGSLNAQNVLVNIANQVPYLMQLITALSYVMGMYFIISGIMKLKHVGEARTQMSHEHHLMTPITLISVGVMLIYLPSAVNTGMSTFWANPNPYGYLQQQDQWSSVINDCYLIIQFIGALAFIRGLVLLSHGGGHGQSNFGKALTHIIGGILCINIYQFVQVVLSTIGIQT